MCGTLIKSDWANALDWCNLPMNRAATSGLGHTSCSLHSPLHCACPTGWLSTSRREARPERCCTITLSSTHPIASTKASMLCSSAGNGRDRAWLAGVPFRPTHALDLCCTELANQEARKIFSFSCTGRVTVIIWHVATIGSEAQARENCA